MKRLDEAGQGVSLSTGEDAPTWTEMLLREEEDKNPDYFWQINFLPEVKFWPLLLWEEVEGSIKLLGCSAAGGTDALKSTKQTIS